VDKLQCLVVLDLYRIFRKMVLLLGGGGFTRLWVIDDYCWRTRPYQSGENVHWNLRLHLKIWLVGAGSPTISNKYKQSK
jgi:hypothetical protein